MLLYCLAKEAESVLKSTNITEEETKNYETVLEKLDSFFQVRRNVIFNKACFNCRCQFPGESVEQYIIELYNLVEHCNYGDFKSEMIRDRLVVDILDKTLSEHLQLDPALTLEKAKQMIHQHEAVQEHQQVLKGAGTNSLEEMCHPRNKKTPGDTGKQKVDDMTRGVPDRDKLILTAVHGVAKSAISKNNVLQRMWCVNAANGKDTTKSIVLLN